ncbi:DUF3606 domain-containing protein [Bordetella sp. 15P40C-2]|nr:DUF3606 domain-containing protein [Bordetella sp. 15P40C-2]
MTTIKFVGAFPSKAARSNMVSTLRSASQNFGRLSSPLRQAVQAVGVSADAVKAYLKET